MRYLILLLIAGSLHAADREILTMKDGRTLIGVYDADAGTIEMDGKTKAIVPVRAEQIASREAATAVLPAATAPSTKVETGAGSNESKTDDQQLHAAVRPTVDPWKQLKEMQDRQTTEMLALARRLLESLDLKRIPEVNIGDDPRESERALRAEVQRINERVDELIATKQRNINNGWKSLNVDIIRDLYFMENWWPDYERLRPGHQ